MRFRRAIRRTCREEPDLRFKDDAYQVIVNTKGTRGELTDEMKEVILYLDKGEITGAYSQSLEDAVNTVKASEERRVEYMSAPVRCTTDSGRQARPVKPNQQPVSISWVKPARG